MSSTHIDKAKQNDTNISDWKKRRKYEYSYKSLAVPGYFRSNECCWDRSAT